MTLFGIIFTSVGAFFLLSGLLGSVTHRCDRTPKKYVIQIVVGFGTDFYRKGAK